MKITTQEKHQQHKRILLKQTNKQTNKQTKLKKD